MASDFLGAELSLSRAYMLYKSSDNKDKLYGTLNQLGLVYNELKEYDKAVFYHTKALETVKKFKLQSNQHQEAVCYNNLGYLFIKQKKYKEAISYFELGLIDKTDIKNQNPEWPAFKKYFMHGTSHYIGLDTHDVGLWNVPIQAGMVFTCEPGIYIPEEKLGIRLEDDLVVMKSGAPYNLMKDIPLELEEIETLMNQ